MIASHAVLLMMVVVVSGVSQQVELAGVSVAPHVGTPGIKYRAGDPPAPGGALVRLFGRNAGEQAVVLREAMFDRQSPLSLVPNGDWSWADVPSVWTGERVTLPPGALTVLSFNGTSGRWPAGRRFPLLIETDEPPGGRFELPAYLRPTVALVRVDADGITRIDFENTDEGVRFTDQISQVGVYGATTRENLPALLEAKRQPLWDQERGLGFDPAGVAADLETLRALLPAQGR